LPFGAPLPTNTALYSSESTRARRLVTGVSYFISTPMPVM
jgi:hypothetical protein